MHFFYLDETGDTGKDLTQVEQPIFVLGGVIIRDEGWNRTHNEFETLLNRYFHNNVPDNFELHTQDLFSPNGSGAFEGHSRERRNGLIGEILDLISYRSHHIYFVGIDKRSLLEFDITPVLGKAYFDLKIPYLLGYDYLIHVVENYISNKLGRSARGMFIIDEKDNFMTGIESISRYRRFDAPNAQQIKLVTEFSYPIDSRKNLMVQLSDLCIFLIRKFLEIENDYKNEFTPEVKEIFRGFYRKINARLITKTFLPESYRNARSYNELINAVISFPSTRWNSREY